MINTPTCGAERKAGELETAIEEMEGLDSRFRSLETRICNLIGRVNPVPQDPNKICEEERGSEGLLNRVKMATADMYATADRMKAAIDHLDTLL